MPVLTPSTLYMTCCSKLAGCTPPDHCATRLESVTAPDFLDTLLTSSTPSCRNVTMQCLVGCTSDARKVAPAWRTLNSAHADRIGGTWCAHGVRMVRRWRHFTREQQSSHTLDELREDARMESVASVISRHTGPAQFDCSSEDGLPGGLLLRLHYVQLRLVPLPL
jgi:hypothetical protein